MTLINDIKTNYPLQPIYKVRYWAVIKKDKDKQCDLVLWPHDLNLSKDPLLLKENYFPKFGNYQAKVLWDNDWTTLLKNTMIVCLFGVIFSVENFTLIERHLHCWWRASNFNVYLALMAIGQWMFFSIHIYCGICLNW